MTDVETDDAKTTTWQKPTERERDGAHVQLARMQTKARGSAQGGNPYEFRADRYHALDECHPLGEGLITPIPACYRTETKILYLGTPGEPKSYEWLINTVLKAFATPPHLQMSNTIRCLRKISGGTKVWYQITLGAREFVAGGCNECEESRKAEELLAALSLAFGIRIETVEKPSSIITGCRQAIAKHSK